VISQRQVPRPHFDDADGLLLSMLARLLPRDRWTVLLVTPATLMRWHRNWPAGTGPSLTARGATACQ